MIEFYGARALIFDGSTPYSGLLRATAPRRDLSLIWVRRAFWKPEQHNDDLVARQRFFDLIIEPEDIAESCDEGATVAERGRATRVPPIRLLDPEELLPRAEAAAALGIDPKRPAVLVQLGGGATRNLATLTDLILTGLRRFPRPAGGGGRMGHLRFAARPVAEREAPHRLPDRPLLPGLRLRRLGRWDTTPITTCSAPACRRIFVPDDHVMMDDQVARARFAESGGAAIVPTPFTAGDLQDRARDHARPSDPAAAASRLSQARRAERGGRRGPTHRRPTARVTQP